MDSQSFRLRYISLWGFQSSPHALVYQGHGTANTTILLCLLKISIQMEQDSNLLSTSLFDWCSMGPAIHFWFSVCLIFLAVWKQISGSTAPSLMVASILSYMLTHDTYKDQVLPGHTPLRQVAETFSSRRRPHVPGSVAIAARSLRVGSTRSQSKLNFTHFPVHRVIQCHHSTIKKNGNRPFPGK